MKKFTDNKITNQPKKKTITIESLVNDNLQVKVEGGIDKFLEKEISIDGKEKLIGLLNDYLNEEKHKIIENIRYRGIEQTSKLLENKKI